MKQKRVSSRKSQLKFFIEDFCLENTAVTDPIVGYLLTIMEWEASLSIETPSILHQAFQGEMAKIKYLIKQELKYNDANNQEKFLKKINKHVSDYQTLNQLFSYCLILTQKKSEFYGQLEKFKEYQPQPSMIVDDLQAYLNKQVIFETIFRTYRNTYNVNVFTAELMGYLQSQHEANLLTETQKPSEQKQTWENKEYEELSSQSVNFKRLNQINKKYECKWEKLKQSYISKILNISQSVMKGASFNPGKHLKEKLIDLNSILQKISCFSGTQRKLIDVDIIDQSAVIFEKLDFLSNSNERPVLNMNKTFLKTHLFGNEQSGLQPFEADAEFSFLKNKIVKIQSISYFNSIIVALNVLSFIYNELDLDIRVTSEYSFQCLSECIESQFIGETLWDNRERIRSRNEKTFLNDALMITPDLFMKSNKRILYPSAIRSLYKLIRNILKIKVQSQQVLLSVLKLITQKFINIQQTILGCYNIVKAKQIATYGLIQRLIQLLLQQSSFENRQQCFNDSSHLIRTLIRQKQKAGIISQIISELDGNYDVQQLLKQLIKISQKNIAYSQQDKSISLYRAILSEIIKVRNGLKLNHHYSLNQIHQHFSLIPMKKIRDGEKQESLDIYFQDIIEQICKASSTELCLPKLFFFFSLHMKLKVIIFKLQLFWSEKKDLMFQKKQQAFKQFIHNYCSPIFALVEGSSNFIDVLSRVNDLQRLINILNNQVERFHLVQKVHGTMSRIVEIPDLREHINRLSHQQLSALNKTMTEFNPIQGVKSQDIKSFALKLKTNINNYSRIRLEEMGEDQPNKIGERTRLSHIIYFMNCMSGSSIKNEHISLGKMYRNEEFRLSLTQIKQEETIRQHYYECFKGDQIDQVSVFYDRLFLISIQQMINQLHPDNINDLDYLRELLKFFKFHETFLQLDKIEDTYFWKEKAMLTTKYHQIYQLMFFLNKYQLSFPEQLKNQPKFQSTRNKVEKPAESDIIMRLYILNQISPVTRLQLHKRVQQLQFKIINKEPLYKNPRKYLKEAMKHLYKTFCDVLNLRIKQTDLGEMLGFSFDETKPPTHYFNQLRGIMLGVVNHEVKIITNSNYKNKEEIELFGEIKGFEIAIVQENNKKFKIANHKQSHSYNKKQAIIPYRTEEDKAVLRNIKAKVKIDILKRTLSIRKQIAWLQLDEKRMRNDITWQTQKLKHNVVEKINQFIIMSKMDQQQSYINFKHTVNLETIKGIENVIDEQTEMYMKKQEAYPHNDLFLTDYDQQAEEQKLDRLLDINVQAICENMKLIKIFWGWKKLLKRTDNTKKQWILFNENVKKILNNQELIQNLNETRRLRRQFLRNDVECEMTKQNNYKTNVKIQQLKIQNLEKKVNQYRSKLVSG